MTVLMIDFEKEADAADMILMFRKGVKPEQKKEPAINRELKRFNDNIAQSKLIPEIHEIGEVSPEQIIEIAEAAEIRDELDGRSLAEKLREAKEKGVKTVIADAVDDEPYISSRLIVLMHYRNEVVSGLKLCAKALSLEESAVSVAVYQELLDFSFKIPEGDEVRIHHHGGKYPVDLPLRMAGEKNGILYLGTGALLHLHRAVYEMRRQTTIFVTLAGDCVSNPFNAEIPLEMPLQRALEFCGLSDDPTYICVGGSMTAKPVLEPERTFAAADTRAILAFHRYDDADPTNCIGCGKCGKVCPQGLPVFYLYRACLHKELSIMRRMELERCFECGACSYVCPARLDIVSYLRSGKELLERRREKMAKKPVPEAVSETEETVSPASEAAEPVTETSPELPVPKTNETSQQEVNAR